MEQTTRKELAMRYFTDGYNCSQAVVLAFADLLPVDPDTLSRLASSFGGGMGRLREVCGAVSGMFMVTGLLYGYAGPESGEAKAAHYARIQELAGKFRAENGAIVCRELLGQTEKKSAPVPEPRTAEYYKKRPCAELVGSAAEILEEYLSGHPVG